MSIIPSHVPSSSSFPDSLQQQQQQQEQYHHDDTYFMLPRFEIPDDAIPDDAIPSSTHCDDSTPSTKSSEQQSSHYTCNSDIDCDTNIAATKITIHQTVHEKVWLERYEELVDFHQQHGHCNVPQLYKKNKALGLWVSYQRFCFKNKTPTLTDERIAALDHRGFIWENVSETIWEKRYNELIAFKRQHGHYNVCGKGYDKKVLGCWFKTQKVHYALLCKGEPSMMTTERLAKLRDIGVDLRNQNDVRWQKNYDVLRAFKQMHGHCNVLHSNTDNKSLVNWVHNQRSRHYLLLKGKKSSLTPERIHALENIGFQWTTGAAKKK